MSTYPILYQLKNGKKYCWSIQVHMNDATNIATIVTSYGYENGKQNVHNKIIQDSDRRIKRTVLQQASQEAQRKWTNKKEKELYQIFQIPTHIDDTNDVNETNKKTDIHSTEPICTLTPSLCNTCLIRPMLAQTANLDKTKGYTIPFPAVIQRKYDGIRCLVHRDSNGHVLFESRKGTPFVDFPVLSANLLQLYIERDIPNHIYLDGELFTDKMDFETLSGLTRSKTYHTNKNKIDYYVYDMIDTTNLNMTFIERCEKLYHIFNADEENSHENSEIETNYRKIKLVKSVVAENIPEIQQLHHRFVNEGYEGLIMRDMAGIYQINKRSKYLQKYKKFMDAEFKIIGFHEGSGNEKGAVIWECETDTHGKFAVRPSGTFESRKQLYTVANTYIGQLLTVVFQEYSADGIPRFPVGKGIRNDGI